MKGNAFQGQILHPPTSLILVIYFSPVMVAKALRGWEVSILGDTHASALQGWDNLMSLVLLWAGGLREITFMGCFQPKSFCDFVTLKMPMESRVASSGFTCYLHL